MHKISFFENIGKMAIGTRLRMLNEIMVEDAYKIYDLYEVPLKPKWFPVFYLLSHNDGLSITGMAEEIGLSHPSVSQTVREMRKAGVVTEAKDQNDGRRNLITLSEKGRAAAEQIKFQYTDINATIEDMLAQTKHNLWEALNEFEWLLEQEGLFKRILKQKKRREAALVEIVDYTPQYRDAFRQLNEAWITNYFKMEDADRKALHHPKTYILDNGGHIVVALYQGEPVGVCALIKMDDPEYDYELAKMAVSPKAQGKGIGFLLGKAVEAKARELGAKALYLESNTKLKPAINLYYKLGYEKLLDRPSPYERANIQMGLALH
ncbi:MAG: helix-turn-helix domain-containing GNAT family N-acetyltransferase [Bacteroidota bacterium]